MHTQQSDGQLAPEAVIDQAIHLGLEELAITDHHTVNGYYRAAQYLEDWQWKHPARIRASGKRKVARSLPRLWTGVEITSRLAEVDVHILGYAFQPGHAAMQPYLSGHSP
ncbi:MAG TPA: PHP domain-containing protein, partial [Candidatus Obscuribacterales bacterium]